MPNHEKFNLGVGRTRPMMCDKSFSSVVCFHPDLSIFNRGLCGLIPDGESISISGPIGKKMTLIKITGRKF